MSGVLNGLAPPSHSATSRPSPSQCDSPSAIGSIPPGTVTLGKLLARAGDAVRAGLPAPVWVLAAVATIKPARGGHTLELIEAEAPGTGGQLRAYLPDAVLDALRRASGQALVAAHFVGLSAVLQLRCEFSPRWGLSARVTALAPGLETSLAAREVEAARARLRAAGLLDRQRRLPLPRDVTRVAVVHPPDAAGWADVAGELRRWAAAGVLTVRSVPVPFEGPGAAAALALALGRAAAAVDSIVPDLVLLVRGGGARAGLAPLDDEDLARAIAMAPVPIVTGLGHASDSTLADEVAWRADTPSKALGVVRELIAQPARRARTDHAVVLAAVLAGVDRAGPALDAAERRVTAEALRQAVAASDQLQRSWGVLREAAEGARGRLARLDDRLDRLAADIVEGAPLRVDRTAAELAAVMEAIRSRARRASEGAEDGTRHLAIIAGRAVSSIDRTGVDLATLGRVASAAVAARVDRDDADLEALARTIRERGHETATHADDGARAVAVIEAVTVETLRAQHVSIARLRETIEAAVDRRVDTATAALDRVLATLDGVDPVRVLRLGYALVTDGQGRVVTSVAATWAASTPLTLSFADGTIAVRLIQPQPSIGDRS